MLLFKAIQLRQFDLSYFLLFFQNVLYIATVLNLMIKLIKELVTPTPMCVNVILDLLQWAINVLVGCTMFVNPIPHGGGSF